MTCVNTCRDQESTDEVIFRAFATMRLLSRHSIVADMLFPHFGLSLIAICHLALKRISLINHSQWRGPITRLVAVRRLRWPVLFYMWMSVTRPSSLRRCLNIAAARPCLQAGIGDIPVIGSLKDAWVEQRGRSQSK